MTCGRPGSADPRGCGTDVNIGPPPGDMAGLIGDIGLHISVGFCVIICIGAMICCPTGDVGSHVAVTGAIGCACHAGGGVFNCTSSAPTHLKQVIKEMINLSVTDGLGIYMTRPSIY